MATKVSSREGNIREFKIFQAKDGGNMVDASEVVVDIKYYEDVLSNSVSLSAIITESGETRNEKMGNKGMLDGLPIRGGEPCTIVLEDHDGNKLSFKNDSKLYVNRIKNVIAGTQKDVYGLDFSSRELFANEQCRVVKRYDGKISENIKKILTENTSGEVGLKTKKEVVCDETLVNYNFIGNDRKPFYVCTWLASKSIPAEAGELGGAAGYLFYETHDGFNFRSIDALFKQESKGNYLYNNTDDNPEEYDGKIISYNVNRDIDLQNNLLMGAYSNRTLFFDFYAMNYKVRNFSVDTAGAAESKEGGSKGNYLYNNTDDNPEEYDGKIISYTVNRDIDLQNNLLMGAYSNRTLFFDFYAMNYKVRNFSVDTAGAAESKEGGSKGKIETGGKDGIDSVADEFRKPISRLMNRVKDVGTLPSGKNIDEQLEKWKDKPDGATYDSEQTMVQSVMRYNQLFSVKINIMIAGDFSLRAGDLIHCEFPELSAEPNMQVNKKSGGIYMISSLCHNITPSETFTSLTLVRDTFGRKPFK